MSLKEYDVCDNVFLGEVVSEFESFYEVKFRQEAQASEEGERQDLHARQG